MPSKHNAALPPEQTRELRARIARLYARAPHGLKGAIAEALGYSGRWKRHSLRGLGKGRSLLFRAQSNRIRSILDRMGDDPIRVARLSRRFRAFDRTNV